MCNLLPLKLTMSSQITLVLSSTSKPSIYRKIKYSTCTLHANQYHYHSIDMIYIVFIYILNTSTLRTLMELPDWRKKTIIAELWIVYGYYFFFLPMQDPYIQHNLQVTYIQPVSRLQLFLSNAH